MSGKWINSKTGAKTWVHSAAALTAGHVVYNVKYLGSVEVSAPKGADIVKEAVTKLKFNKQVKRSEGTKPPKRELTISVDGVTIQDKHTKEKQFSYPLHHISYCADDKSDKKVCAFIAKDVKDNKHMCHVMESDKNAEEITLSVGQAFDLAYQKFLSNASKNQEQQQQNDTLKKRITDLEEENKKLKQRVVELELRQGLNPSYSIQTNGHQEPALQSPSQVNPFSALPEPSVINHSSEPTQLAPPSEPVTAINLLADLQLSETKSDPSLVGFDEPAPVIPRRNTLAEQAASYQPVQPSAPPGAFSDIFQDTFAPPPSTAPPPAPILAPPPAPAARTVDPILPPPPPAPPRQKEPPSPLVVQPPPEPQSPVPPSPTVNGAQAVNPAIARSRPRPQGVSQGPGVIAPPPRSLRRGDSGPISPPPTSQGSNAGLGIDDLYAAVSKVSKMNGGGAAPSTASPNPFTPPSSSTTEFSFGDNLDFLGNKGSSSNAASSSSNAFSILDLDPLK